MNEVLMGLQWAGIAFGIFVLVLVVWCVLSAGAKFAYGPSKEVDNSGAPEGDTYNSLNFLRREIDELDEERF